jgi:hypothetical protein
VFIFIHIRLNFSELFDKITQKMKLSKGAPAEEYFPRGKPKGEDKGGGGVKAAGGKVGKAKDKSEGRMVSLFGKNKENKKVADKKKNKIKKGKEKCSLFVN